MMEKTQFPKLEFNKDFDIKTGLKMLADFMRVELSVLNARFTEMGTCDSVSFYENLTAHPYKIGISFIKKGGKPPIQSMYDYYPATKAITLTWPAPREKI